MKFINIHCKKKKKKKKNKQTNRLTWIRVSSIYSSTNANITGCLFIEVVPFTEEICSFGERLVWVHEDALFHSPNFILK